jgi:hypothetical protein
MGTRSLTFVREQNGRKTSTHVCMYRQYDGYPSGHGLELAEFLKGKRLVNGFGSGDTKDTAFNGVGCLSASMVAHFKTDIGGFYLYPTSTTDAGLDYQYDIICNDKNITVKVKDYSSNEIFKGSVDEFEKFCTNEK